MKVHAIKNGFIWYTDANSMVQRKRYNPLKTSYYWTYMNWKVTYDTCV